MFTKISSININNNPVKSLVQAKKIETLESRFGQVLVLIEINEPGQYGRKISEAIIDSLNKNYYLNDKMTLSDSLSSPKIEVFFESALVKTGKDLLSYIDKEKISFDLDKLNISVALIYEGEIYLSNSGHNKAFLLRKVKNENEISDINPDDDHEEESGYKAGKIFSSIINGEIPNNSYIIMTNPSLSEYILREDIIEIINKLKLEGAKEQIKNILKNINTYSNFSGILIKNCLLEEKMKNNSLANSGADFRPEDNHLNQSENKTEKLLTNTGSIDRRKLNNSFKKIIDRINIFKFLFVFFKKIKKNNKNHAKTKDLPEFIVESDIKKSKVKKILAILALTLLLFLIISTYLKRNEEKKVVEDENIFHIESSIDKKQSQIDSFLLYGDEIKSIDLIAELRAELESLSEKERNKLNNLVEIEKKLEGQINQIRKMIRIEKPKELSNLSVLSNEINPSSISISNNTIYIVDAKSGTIYSVDSGSGLSSELVKSDFIKSEKVLSNKDQGDNSYFLNDKYFININKDQEVTYTSIDLNISNIKSLDIYLNYLYVLDTSKKEIIRYSKSNKQYASPETRLKIEDDELASIFIDNNGYTHLLTKSGLVLKYYGTRKEDFNIDIVDPIIDNPKIARLGKKYIYILETNRVIIFQKDKGVFINQYSSDKFNDLKDLAINEDDKKIYLLNGNLVYEIDMIL